MKKSIAIILIIVALIIGAGGVFIGFYLYNQSIVEMYQEQITILQNEKDAIGPTTECYTYKSDVKKGQLITAEMLTTEDIPVKMVNESFVTNKDQIIGKYSKVTILRGTPITADILMEDDVMDEKSLYNTIREYDVVVNLWPIGLELGDYVDMRITMPFGEEYIVLSHMRINGMSSGTVKFLMTEPQMNLYQSALVDYYLHSAEGVMLYFTKYIEPGVQEKAVVTYKVSDQIMTAMKHNPNLYPTAWASVYDTVARRNFEKDILGYDGTITKDSEGKIITWEEQHPVYAPSDEAVPLIAGGRSAWASSISGGNSSYTDEAKEQEKADKNKNSKSGGDDDW